MDLDSIEGLNEVRPAVYRAALKLRALQKLCQMHLVSLQDLRPVLNILCSSGEPMISLAQEDVQQHLEELFQSISHELPCEEVPEATDQTTRLLFKLFDREQTGVILLRSVEAALVALSLFRLAESYSGNQESDRGSISRSALKILLEDLSHVPAVVQENHVFGHAEAAVSSCFSGIIGARVTEEHFIGWLQSEPRLLLWLSTLYRISVSEAVQHRVRCHACKAFPITGLRYRCLKCLNVHLCQSCFLTERRSRKHKPSHPVLEYCTQPSWKESMASLASSARHALVPRHTRREAERKRALRASSNAELQYIAPSPVLQSVAHPDVRNAPETGLTAIPPVVTVETKCLQTEETEIPQRETAILQKDISVTQKAMRELQRDKWLLEKEFQVWRVAAHGEDEVEEGREAYQKGRIEVDEETFYEVSEDISTNLDDIEEDVHTASGQQEEVEEEKLLEEQDELLHERQDISLLTQSLSDLALKEHSDSGDSEMDEEEELCELVQRLRNELSLYTATGLVSMQKEKLMSAAEGVRDSVSHLVSSVRTISLA
ncbi:Dystrotelin [Labeo rohita]|uniref:Dystrotelin n=1 Tax=Labeo rohita TaxID=84645 RepID=A0ABQ8MLW6_LABRO|nr:Dystrotelin [Labeo rohita]